MSQLNIDSIISLGQNIAFLLCLPLICHSLWHVLKNVYKPFVEIATGLVFAAVTIIGMLSPLRVIPGLIIDGRVAIIAVAGIYSTPTAIVATILIVLFRLTLGGVGIPSAIDTIFTAAVIGIAARRYFGMQLQRYSTGKLLLIGMSLVAATGFWAYISPFPEAWTAFITNLPAISVWYPISTILLGNLLAQELSRQRIENELRTSNERYLSIVNDQLDLVARWTPSGQLTFVNEAYSKFFQRPRDELVGQTLFLLLNDTLSEEAQRTTQGLTPSNPVLRKVVYMDLTSETKRWFEWIHRGFFNHQQLVEIQSVARDVTERKEAETRLKYQQKFERLLIKLATDFINVPSEELDSAINNALKEIGEFLGGIRCIINLISEDMTIFTRTYEWHRVDIDSLQGVSTPMLDPDKLTPRLASGEDVIVSNADELRQWPDLAQESIKIGAKAVVFVPLIREGRLREIISLTWDHPISIEPEALDLIHVLGEIYLNVVERKAHDENLHKLNLELEQRVESRTTELSAANQRLQQEVTERKQAQEAEHAQRMFAEALRDTAAVLNSTLNLNEVLDHILINMDRVVKHNVANIMLIEGDTARIVRYRGYKTGESISSLRFPIAGVVNLNWMVEHKESCLISDVRNYEGWVEMPGLEWIASYLGVPICHEDEVIGFLNFDCSIAGFFTTEHEQRLRVFADQAAIAISNARLYEQSNKIAALEERQRLARELHDSVSQMLFSANSIAEILPRILEKHPQKAGQYITNLHNFTRGAMGEMRTLLIELRPESLIRTELGLLLGQLCDALTGRTQIEVEKHIDTVTRFPSDIQIAFYRIAQEAFNNVSKHAQAKKVDIDLHSIDNRLEMIIKDDGKGFDPAGVSSHHFGLQIMKERAASVNAQFEIHSQPDTGTKIIVWRLLDE